MSQSNPASDCATHNEPTNESDILSKLADLHKQATTERSHYYVASVVRESVIEITRLREMLNHFGRLAEQDHNHLTAEITSLSQRLGKIAHAPVPLENKIAMTLKRWAATNPGEADLPDPFTVLRSALQCVRDTIENDPEDLNSQSISDTIWISPIETMVDYIDAALATRASDPAS